MHYVDSVKCGSEQCSLQCAFSSMQLTIHSAHYTIHPAYYTLHAARYIHPAAHYNLHDDTMLLLPAAHDNKVQIHGSKPVRRKPLYQARESSLVPICLHPVQFMHKA